ncbi:MAG: chemotaxis protein CheB, partial [Rhodoferax sp.]
MKKTDSGKSSPPIRRTKATQSGAARPARKATPEAGSSPTQRSAERGKPVNVFPIVGVGASAGGLEALEQFFKGVPLSCGMAFVVVQHLDPTHKGIMVELLQRSTTMPVLQATERMRVVPDHVYVIPPNCDLSMLHGVLHLLDPMAPRGLRLPIDFFLRALSADQNELGIGVVLSGMGADGTLGLRAIKEHGGVSFVQEPTTAKFDAMPRSAIDAGLADVVAAPAELAGRIVSYLKQVQRVAPTRSTKVADGDQSGLEKVVLLLRTQTGHDFSHYKKSTIYRRIERRMALHQLNKIADYVRFLRENPGEATLLFKELLIGVTSFFRDPPTWEQLRNDVLPVLFAAYPDGAG